MKKLLLLFICFLKPIFGDVSVDGVAELQPPPATTQSRKPSQSSNVKILLDGCTNFGWDLFQKLQKDKENTVFSPYSIYSCLSMTAAGARDETLSEMQKVLRLPSKLAELSNALSANNESLHNHMKIANSLWIAPEFVIAPDFRKTIENDFHASVASLDFSSPDTAASTINQWIAKNTDQKITELLNPNDLPSSTRLVLANALFFSAKFLKPFNPKRTAPQNFWTESSTQIITPMMEQTSVFFYAENETFQTIALPMEASQIAFVVFLPKEKLFSGLSSLMTSDKFIETIEKLDLQNIHVKLPKFILKERFDLNQALSQLGLTKAFTSKANFSGIDGKFDLFLSKVLHEAYFALDESGIVAAAATAAAISTTAVAKPPKEFTADHPFIFALVDLQTKVPLFIGELITPP